MRRLICPYCENIREIKKYKHVAKCGFTCTICGKFFYGTNNKNNKGMLLGEAPPILFEIVDRHGSGFITGEQRECDYDDCSTCNLRFFCLTTGSWKLVYRKSWNRLDGNVFTKHATKLGFVSLPKHIEIL